MTRTTIASSEVGCLAGILCVVLYVQVLVQVMFSTGRKRCIRLHRVPGWQGRSNIATRSFSGIVAAELKALSAAEPIIRLKTLYSEERSNKVLS